MRGDRAGFEILRQRRARVHDSAASHVVERNLADLDVRPQGRPFRREKLRPDTDRSEHRHHCLRQLFIQRVTTHRRRELNVDPVRKARLLDQLLGLLGIIRVFWLQDSDRNRIVLPRSARRGVTLLLEE